MTDTPTPLLPCPFCGGKAIVTWEGSPHRSHIIDCEDCGARKETGEDGHSRGKQWNTRSPHPDLAKVQPPPQAEAPAATRAAVLAAMLVHDRERPIPSFEGLLESILREIAKVQPAAAGSKPVCYGIVANDGTMWMDEGCIYSHPERLEGILEDKQDASPNSGWRIAPLFADARPAAEREGEAMAAWIACSDRMPADGEAVLYVIGGDTIHVGQHESRLLGKPFPHWTSRSGGGPCAWEVTHWQPLPPVGSLPRSGLLSATPAPEPAAPVENRALAEARHELDLLQAVYGGWHERTPREVEIATALAETAPQDRDSADNAIGDLLTIIDGLRGIIWKQPAAPVEVDEAMVKAAVNLLFAYNLRELDGMGIDEAIATKYRIMRRTLAAALECQRGGK